MNSQAKLRKRDYNQARELVWVADFGKHVEDRICSECGREVRVVTLSVGHNVLDRLSRRKTGWGTTARDHKQLCLKYKALG